MPDYHAWVRRAEAFVLGLPEFAGLAPLDDDSDEMRIEIAIAKPLSEKAVARLEKKMSLQLPVSLRQFLLEGSGSCYFSYFWSVPEKRGAKISHLLDPGLFGSANLCNSKEMPEHQAMCHISATDFDWINENREEQEIWLSALPFIYMETGDFLALDLTKDKDDPPVIYLGDPDGHFLVSPNFDEFLRHWEGLCYIEPVGCDLSEFLDKKHHLNAGSKKAAVVRQFFGLPDWS